MTSTVDTQAADPREVLGADRTISKWVYALFIGNPLAQAFNLGKILIGPAKWRRTPRECLVMCILTGLLFMLWTSLPAWYLYDVYMQDGFFLYLIQHPFSGASYMRPWVLTCLIPSCLLVRWDISMRAWKYVDEDKD